MSYHNASRAIAGLRVDTADMCIWLVDERGEEPQATHLTPDQAKAAADALRQAGEGAGNGRSLTIPIWEATGESSD